jgi:hypothetical protein
MRQCKLEISAGRHQQPYMGNEAKRIYDNAYHARRSPEAKQRKVKLQDERRVRNMMALRRYKADRGCADCTEKDPIVLEFDHRDPARKSFNIGNCTKSGWSLERLLQEVAKCDVVCANCHRRRTAKLFWMNG